MGDKVDAGEKADVQAKIDALKEALKGSDIELIKQKQEELKTAFYALSEKLYQAQAQAQAAGAGPADAGPDMGSAAPNGDPNVVDADFTEVDNDQ